LNSGDFAAGIELTGCICVSNAAAIRLKMLVGETSLRWSCCWLFRAWHLIWC